ncbi:MAG: AMP-binding protein [Acidobacteria bacterium]|nr:AMP-binding protein [Acidobacteriota bacterium]
MSDMLSYARGPEAPILEKTIAQALEDSAARFPDREALVARHQEARLTYRELAARVEETARGLAGLGLKPGDRAGVWATSCVEWVLLQLACSRAGVVLVNVNPAYRSHELAFVLRKSGMRALFLNEKDARANYRQILEESRAGGGEALEHVVHLGTEAWDGMLANGTNITWEPPAPEDVTNIQYTSGTTGSPKGVLLTHRNLVNNAWVMANALHLSGEDRICVPVPLYHCFGCVIGTLVAVVSGVTMILPAGQFDPLATLEAVHQERATVLYGVPTMFIAELEHPEFARFDLASLRTGIMAGAPCPIEVMKRVVDQMHCREMTIAYGQTETSPGITMSHVDDSLELRVSTVGCPLANTEVKIVSLSTGETVPVRQQGELCTRGYHVMKGYDQEPEATRRAIDEEGWLHTGDLATMQPNGYFRITGRAKEMIIRGGENIYPREVEEFLYTNPKIADVYVVGLPDIKLGETVLAWVRLKAGETATEEEIREFCRGKIAHFKIPQYIRFVDSFPMTVTGKVQKFRIRQEEIRARGLEQAAKIETA